MNQVSKLFSSIHNHFLRKAGQQLLLVLAFLSLSISSASGSDLVITGVVDGPLSGGVPKAVELYALNNIADLSIYAIGSANNGGGSDGDEFTFPAIAVSAGDFIYVASESAGFSSFFGFAPDYTSQAASINGDDAIELFQNGTVVDIFGDINLDGTGQPWEYLDGWAYRQNATGPDGTTFTIANWSFSGPNALDGETTNAAASSPFPLGSYSGSGGGGPTASELLLSEIVVTPTTDEFIEIYNPGGSAVDLSNVYLTDATFAPGGVFYYNIVTGANAGGGGFSDFHARFPDGASIAAGEYQTVSMAGSDVFFASFGVNPTYELYEDGGSPDAIADMREALPGSINNQGGLTNGGEVVVLYSWDGESDLVQDLDYAVWGDKDEGIDKTGIAIDGPDADSDTSSYAAETSIADQDVVLPGAHSSGNSFSRIDLAEGTEIQMGGNGIDGDDETSENLSVTWLEEATTPNAATPEPPPPPLTPTLLLNEFMADPASGIDGDANGDGARDSSEDEFVELVNISGDVLDISGWTISDGVGVRHVFPAGTVLADQCAAVVFGGGYPTGTFGYTTVQTASTGMLGLNNGGDTILVSSGSGNVVDLAYGGEGGDNQSLTLDPDVTGTLPMVKHSQASGSGGSLFSPGTTVDGNAFPGCAPEKLEIYQIQGSGLNSAFDGRYVDTSDNIVTAVGPEGFTMQTPDARDDGDADTSNGIYVYTGSIPVVAVGDQVDVIGRVVEFYDLTEISGFPEVNVDSPGNSLPAIVVLDPTVPSPDPSAPSCTADTLECFEGMLVSISGVVTGPSQSFGSDPVAEAHIAAGSERTFREPGIEYPGLTGLPVWDGNPEVFEIDPDRFGLPNQAFNTGALFDATGVIGYEFGGYELWVTDIQVTDPGLVLPVPVRARVDNEMTVGSLNLFRLFDDVDDGGDFVADSAVYAMRLGKFSDYIRNVLDSPDILAIQEVEKLGVLEELAAVIAADDPAINYTAYLVEGNDVGGIDVGFMVRDSVAVDSVTQLGADEILGFDGSLLHDRPPLLLEGRNTAGGSDFPVAVMAIHNRSLSRIDDSNDGERVRQKRLEQAESIASKVQALQTNDSDINLVVIGDFNAFEFSDSYVDVTGHMKGEFVAEDNLVCDTNPCVDIVEPDLVDQILILPADERYTFNFRGNAQALDHALTSTGLDELITDFMIGRGNSDAPLVLLDDGSTPLRSSDHDGLVLFLVKDSDGDGVTDDLDYCPGTVIPESVPTRKLVTNNFALVNDDRVFDTESPKGEGPQVTFDIFDTAGCSCEQIIDEQGLGKGHSKFGCSIGVMKNWVDGVDQP